MGNAMHSLKTLLQLPCGWRCSRQIISSDGITLHLHGKRKTAQCPECFKRSDSVHSCRRRRIQHLPCSGQTLWLVFSVRHWYCRNPACSRKIFAESLAPFAGSHQQSSQALQNLQRQLGLIAGGEAGKRAATAAGLRCSADTLLRRVINTPETKQSGAPHVGIDEWAWHRGHRYSTLIVNLDTHRPLSSCFPAVISVRWRPGSENIRKYRLSRVIAVESMRQQHVKVHLRPDRWPIDGTC